jgi:hypothetical protein
LPIHTCDRRVSLSTPRPTLTFDAPSISPIPLVTHQAAAVVPAAAANAADDQGVASSRMSYSRFLVRLSPCDDRQCPTRWHVS